MANQTHARLAPSSAVRWVPCPASVILSEKYPELGQDVEAMEGEAAHWGAAHVLRDRGALAVGMKAPNGILIDQEMNDAVGEYIRDVMQHHAAGLHIEETVCMPSINADNWGTPDCWVFSHNFTTGQAELIVWDFKYGHEFVEVFENWQLLNYAAGILESMGINGLADQYLTVRFRVVQPRSYHRDGPIREWRVPAVELRGYFNKLAHSAAVALGPNPTLNATPACKHCPARHACEAAQRESYRLVETVSKPLPVELPTDALSYELRALMRAAEILKARISGLQDVALDKIKRGERVPYFAAEFGTGRTVWVKPVDEVIALGNLLGHDLAKPGVITPKQAAKLGIDQSLIDAYSETPKGEMSLVLDDGKAARKAFGS